MKLNDAPSPDYAADVRLSAGNQCQAASATGGTVLTPVNIRKLFTPDTQPVISRLRSQPRSPATRR
jgi:hypothetical protein